MYLWWGVGKQRMRNFVKKLLRKWPTGRVKNRQEDTIKMYLGEQVVKMGCR
jgi:hypothetical protein